MNVVCAVVVTDGVVRIRMSDLTDDASAYHTVILSPRDGCNDVDIIVGTYNIELYRAYDILPGPVFCRSSAKYEYRVRVQNADARIGVTLHIEYTPSQNSFKCISAEDEMAGEDPRVLIHTTETVRSEMVYYGMCCIIAGTPAPYNGGILHTIAQTMVSYNRSIPESFLPTSLPSQYIHGQRMALCYAGSDIWDITAAYPRALSLLFEEHPFLQPVSSIFSRLYHYRLESKSLCVKLISNITTGMFLAANDYAIHPSICTFFADLYSLMVNAVREVIVSITKDIPVLFCYVDSICVESAHSSMIISRIAESPYQFKHTSLKSIVLVSPTSYVAQTINNEYVIKGMDDEAKILVNDLARMTKMFTIPIPDTHALNHRLITHRSMADYHQLFQIKNGRTYCFIYNCHIAHRTKSYICPLCHIGLKS